MKKILLSLLLVVSISSKAVEVEDIVTSPETFAVCKIIDIASTSYLITRGLAYEANPIVAPLIVNGYFPLVLLSAGLYWVLKQKDSKPTNTVANALTCGVAVNNILLIP